MSTRKDYGPQGACGPKAAAFLAVVAALIWKVIR